jgi:hypothetical protein
MSFEHRLREGLDGAAANPHTDVGTSLARVLTRRRRRVRVRRTVSAVVATGVIATLAVGVPIILDERGRGDATVVQPAPTPGLPGRYEVDVADSDLAARYLMSGRWVVELGERGSVDFVPPDAFEGPTSGFSYSTEGNELRIDAFISDALCQEAQVVEPVGTYRWTRTATALELDPVSETCAARELLLAGQPWQVLP